LDPIAFFPNFLNQFWIAASLVSSFCEAMAGSLSMAGTAVLLAKVAVVGSFEFGRSAVYSRYNNGPRTLPWGTPALTRQSSLYTVSAFTGNVYYANRIADSCRWEQKVSLLSGSRWYGIMILAFVKRNS
jgi:hypothetical protein